MTDERRRDIRAKCLTAKMQAESFLSEGETGKMLHEFTHLMTDLILELENELKHRDQLKAQAVIAIRDSMIKMKIEAADANYHEAYHQLVKYADPDFGFDHWGKHEKILLKIEQEKIDRNLKLSES